MSKNAKTRDDVIRLTVANAVNSGVRVVVPIVLVRILDQAEFGQYRLFWLIANTLTLLLPLGMTRSLLYFIPRGTSDERSEYLSQTLFYLAVVSLPVAVLLASGGYLLPERVSSLTEPDWILGAFAFLWVMASTVLILPNADQHIRWQMWIIILFAIARAAIILLIAIVTQSLQAIFVGLLILAAVKVLFLGIYIKKQYKTGLRFPSMSGLGRQLKFAVPFGISGTLARAREQAEQWLVAFLFAPQSLAIMSIAVSVNGILTQLRLSVGGVILPKMSSTQKSGNVGRALELNNRGNIAICFIVFPVVCFLWTFAPEIVSLLYTEAYLDAVPLIRIYSINMLLMSVELATVLVIFEQGRFVAKVSASLLVWSILLSYLGAKTYGLPGVVLGSMLATLITRITNFRRAAKLLELPLLQLQDWPTLAIILVAATLSGVLSAFVVYFLIPTQGTLVVLLVGSANFGFAYLLLVYAFRAHWVLLSMLGKKNWPDRTVKVNGPQSS